MGGSKCHIYGSISQVHESQITTSLLECLRYVLESKVDVSRAVLTFRRASVRPTCCLIHAVDVFIAQYFEACTRANHDCLRVTSYFDTPRFWQASVLVGHKIVVHGGWNGSSCCYEDLWVFDTDSFAWMQPRSGGLPPTARCVTGILVAMKANTTDLQHSSVPVGRTCRWCHRLFSLTRYKISM